MKQALFAAAAIALAASAAPALAQTSGQVEASYAHTEIEVGDWNDSGDAVGLAGQLFAPLSDQVGLQLDGAVSHTADGDGSTAGAATAHLFTRNDHWAVGGFAGVAGDGDDAFWSAGVEAHRYLADVTLAGAIAYGRPDNGDADLWAADGEVRWFPRDNLRLDARAGYTRADSGLDADGWNAGVGVEHQFADSPFSLFANYSHARVGGLADLSADTVMVGVRWTFGADSLKTRDRKGASFHGAGFGGLAGF